MIPRIAIVGSPNVGKSATFGTLTGKYVTVSNYPGTTVEVGRGRAKLAGREFEVIDTPGLYSVFPVTEEERVSLELLKGERPDIVVHVVDAKNLPRSLPLTFGLQELKIPMILVLNMFDEAKDIGMTVNTGDLSRELGMPVVATVAIHGDGKDQLIETIAAMEAALPRGAEVKGSPPQYSDALLRAWHGSAARISARVIKRIEHGRGLSRLDRLLVSPLTGLPILALVLYAGLYKLVGGLGAGTIVDFLEGLFEGQVNPWATRAVEAILPWEALSSLFVGEYGLITLALRYAIAIILPIVGMFFLVFAVIEDSGYLPRLALLLDRAFKRIGLSGRAVIPMVLGLGCDTMATMVTRTLPTRRERFIATLLLALCIPCSAQLGVILGLLSTTPKVLAAWLAIIAGIFVAVGVAAAAFVPGARPSFIMEIPPMRLPQWRNVLVKTWARMVWYFKEIVPLFAAASAIIWILQIAGAFVWIERAMEAPLSAMGLPAEASKAFIFGFFRRDYGAAGLYDLNAAGAFTLNQLLVAVVVLTLFLPCVTQFLITIKERGAKVGAAISLFVLCFAFAAGFMLNTALARLHISL